MVEWFGGVRSLQLPRYVGTSVFYVVLIILSVDSTYEIMNAL